MKRPSPVSSEWPVNLHYLSFTIAKTGRSGVTKKAHYQL
jgi:hypothetical protein